MKNPSKKFTLWVCCLYFVSATLFLIVDGYLGYRKITRLFVKEVLEDVHVVDPKLGWKPKPFAQGHHQAKGSFDVTYEMDENGYKKIDNPRSPSSSFYFFGDSFTFGHGVSNRDTFPAIIADRYLRGDIAVYNLGVMGYGVTQMAVRFLEIEPKLRPNDLVVFALTTMDFTRDVFSFTIPMSLLFSNRVAPFERFPAFQKGHFEYWSMNHWFNRLRLIAEFSPCTGRLLRLLESPQTRSAKAKANLEMNRQLIEMVRRKVEKKSAHFCLLLLPTQEELIARRYLIDPDYAEYLDPLDPGPFFDHQAAPYMFFPEGHWNSLGHQIAAVAILRLFFVNHLVLPDQLKPDAVVKLLSSSSAASSM